MAITGGSSPSPFRHLCPHCHVEGGQRLGKCDVCGGSVCEKCGNTQLVGGKRQVLHDACLKSGGGGFKMIKFVK